MSFKPLTRNSQCFKCNYPYGAWHEDVLRTAYDGFVYDVAGILSYATLHGDENGSFEIIRDKFRSAKEKWFPVFSQSHLNDSTYSSEELRPSGSSMTEPANLDAVAIDLPCNPSQRVETVTSHSHSLFPDQEVRDLNNPLEKGGGSEQTSTLTPISARDFSTLAKQMGFSFYVDGNGKLLISLSQPSVHSEEVESRTQAERSEQHGVPAGELSSVSVGEVDVKHAPCKGNQECCTLEEYQEYGCGCRCHENSTRKGCICKHGSGAITKRFVEENKLCNCECHKKSPETCVVECDNCTRFFVAGKPCDKNCECHKDAGNTSYQNNKEDKDVH